MDSAIFVPFESYKLSQKNTTIVRFTDHYLNIPLWGHSFLMPLHRDSYALIYLP